MNNHTEPHTGNDELKLTDDFVALTGTNIFLTGKAGTGKTTFLRGLKEKSPKRMIVVAPTGVAAINAGGVTIHSFFQLPFTPFVPGQKSGMPATVGKENRAFREIKRFSREKMDIMRSLDLLVIDEISMVRADVLDAMDEVLRRFRDRYQPFGGVQLLMIGDLQQLAPVAKDDEWNILRNYYETVFFFSSHALRKTEFISIELKHIFRQSDQEFIEILNKVRENRVDEACLQKLNSRYIQGFSPDDKEGYIILTTHNAQAKDINEKKLAELPGKTFSFKASIDGDFPEYAFPTDPELLLKPGAQVMFIKNDISPEKLFFNGKIGVIADIDEEGIYVQCPDDDSPIEVFPAEWTNIKYSIDDETKEIKENITGTFVQYPLKLAWAITIHKSQGLTFEKAVIDARAAFAHGQVYVALSRCKSLEGMVLGSPISNPGIISSSTVTGFTSDLEKSPPGHDLLEKSKQNYFQTLLIELFDFKHIRQRLNYAIRIAKENDHSLLGSPAASLEKISTSFSVEIEQVASKFFTQLTQLALHMADPDKERELQDRVVKGVKYFHEKTEALLADALNGIIIETDNKAVSRAMGEVIGHLESEISIKLECLKASAKGFSILDYLEARAKASIEKPKLRKKTAQASSEGQIIAVQHPGLYNLLKAWRNKKMKELDLPAYMIIQTKTMASLTVILPSTKKELKAVKGMGDRKIEQFGDEILAIVNEYCRDNKVQQLPVEMPPAREKKVKGETQAISFAMFREGKTAAEIAAERGIVQSTVESHLSHFVGTGELELNGLVSPVKISKISEYFLNSDSKNLTPAREALGEDYSYSELRFVLKYLEYEGKL